jgi:ABC-2 type transport system permease protein
VRRGTVVVALIAGLLPVLVVAEYGDTFGGPEGAASLTALAENPAISTLFGPPVALDDAGGFAVWRIGTVLAVLVGIWAAMAATRVMRGEEEAGRWDLLLVGRAPLRSLVARHLAVLLPAAAIPGAGLTAGLLLGGTDTAGALVFGAVIAGTGATGAALGALGAQLHEERRSASAFAVSVLLGGLLLRMIGDGVSALGWLQWFTPFGILSRTQPYAGNRLTPLLVLGVLIAVPAVAAVLLAEGRDVGSGRLRNRVVDRRPSRLLGSLPGFAVHRLRRPVLGWGAGIGAYFLLTGLLAKSSTDFLRDNPRFAEMAAQAGFDDLVSPRGYAATLFTVLAVPLGAFCASRISASAADEGAGRLTLLYSRPVGRSRWLVVEAAVTAAGAVLLATVAGLAVWAGTAWVGAGVGPGETVAGAVNVVPVALLCLGAALAALGWLPSAVLPLGVLPAAGGFLLLAFADSFGWPDEVRSLSPFAHLAAVPAESWHVSGALGMTAVAALLAAAGLARYRRRDLRS